jgi:hypothetical protein
MMTQLTRLDFLRKVFSAGMLLSVPPLSIMAGKEKDLYSWTGSAIPVFMYEAYIRGFQYYEGPDEIKNISIGDELDLVREPDNKYDGFATAIYWNAKKLGYLPRDENISIANLLDEGMLFRCTVIDIRPNKTFWESVRVNVELLVPENSGFKKYLLKVHEKNEQIVNRNKSSGKA